MADSVIEFGSGIYTVKLPYTVALDFAVYFVKHGIPVLYKCYGSGDTRTIVFESSAVNANMMLSWIRRWEGGHEYCPFCGGIPEVHVTAEQAIERTRIRCTDCGCMSKAIVWCDSTDAAWKLWDKRTK